MLFNPIGIILVSNRSMCNTTILKEIQRLTKRKNWLYEYDEVHGSERALKLARIVESQIFDLAEGLI